MAEYTYRKNPESPLGYVLDLRQWDTLVVIGEDEEDEHWWLVEDRNGQVGYVPVVFVMAIFYKRLVEQEE